MTSFTSQELQTTNVSQSHLWAVFNRFAQVLPWASPARGGGNSGTTHTSPRGKQGPSMGHRGWGLWHGHNCCPLSSMDSKGSSLGYYRYLSARREVCVWGGQQPRLLNSHLVGSTRTNWKNTLIVSAQFAPKNCSTNKALLWCHFTDTGDRVGRFSASDPRTFSASDLRSQRPTCRHRDSAISSSPDMQRSPLEARCENQNLYPPQNNNPM